MAIEVSSAFSAFDQYVNDVLKLDFGLATWKFSLTKRNLERWNLRPAFVMTPVNVKGFDMNSTNDEIEAGLREHEGTVFAVKVLHGGAYPLCEVAYYVESFDAIRCCVVGARHRNISKNWWRRSSDKKVQEYGVRVGARGLLCPKKLRS
jgi:hypothetical protein